MLQCLSLRHSGVDVVPQFSQTFTWSFSMMDSICNNKNKNVRTVIYFMLQKDNDVHIHRLCGAATVTRECTLLFDPILISMCAINKQSIMTLIRMI